MLCPACQVDLAMSVRQNIEIDYCPKCRGVWLDRGELDKIIEKSAAEAAPDPFARAPAPRIAEPARSNPQPGHEPDHDHRGHKKPYRRKSWFEEIFD